MGLDAAIAKSGELRDALAREVERARGDRELLRAMDSGRLLESAAHRLEFNALAGQLERRIAAELTEAAREHALTEITLASLAAILPEGAAALSRTFGEIRALAAALAKMDSLNRSMAERALACVQGYLTALALLPKAYDRRGYNLAPAGDRATHSLRILKPWPT